MSVPIASPPPRAPRTAAALALLLLGAGAVAAQTPTLPDPIAEFHSSYETWVPHAFGPFPDQTLLRLRSTRPPSHVVLTGLPADADVDAYEWLGENLVWFSLADWAVLPGGLRVHPADIVQWNGSAYAKVFDLLGCGGAPGLNVDALDTNPGLFGGTILLVSFDTNQTFLVDGNPVIVFDEELITLSAGGCQLGFAAITISGSERRWDLDALGMISRWGVLFDLLYYLSYDTWAAPAGRGVVGGPGDVIAYRPFGPTWAEPLHGGYQGTIPERDLDAVWILESGLFADGFESGDTTRWSATAP